MLYGDLDLKKVREAADLDFAHYTYKPGQCSCCYGPNDLPSIYWKNRTVINPEQPEFQNISFLLFLNADNADGTVTKKDKIEHYTCIHYDMSPEQMEIVIDELNKQLDSHGLFALKPKSSAEAIIIYDKEKYEAEKTA